MPDPDLIALSHPDKPDVVIHQPPGTAKVLQMVGWRVQATDTKTVAQPTPPPAPAPTAATRPTPTPAKES